MTRAVPTRRLRRLALAVAVFATGSLHAAAVPGWDRRLGAELARLDAKHRTGLGVYVRDLDSGISVSHRAQEFWYLASTVKLPIAITVLRAIEHGLFGFDTVLTLRTADYVDGAGATNHQPPGAALSVRFLLEQMLIYSDNTASDMLIRQVGLGEVNDTTHALVPWGFQHITTLADVRRQAYGQLAPTATRLSGLDFILLRRQPSDAERMRMLSQILNTPTTEFRMPNLPDAFEAYYATAVNSARLDAYGELLAVVQRGEALNKASTAWLLDTMERSQTGQRRIKAGLPPGVRFAHKTGTQRARTCDSGLLTVPSTAAAPRHIIVVACTRGEASLARSDKALRDVGAALASSGLLAP